MISVFRRYLETWPVRLFFLLMVASFILWGVGDMLRGLVTSTWVVKAAGTTIEAPAFQSEFNRALSVAVHDLPAGQESTQAMRREVGEQTLRRLVGQAAMNQTLRDMRIVVPDAALIDSAKKLPAFKAADGSFDRTRFDLALRNNGLTEQGFLDMMRGDMAQRQLLGSVTAGARVPDAEAAPLFAAQFEKRSADIAAFPLASVPEPPAPDEAAARRWYDNHPDFYMFPEYRTVRLIVLSAHTVENEIAISDADLQDAYAKRIADYTTTAKRAARVISAQDEARAAALAGQWKAGADWDAMQAAAKTAGAATIEQAESAQREFPDPDLAKAVFEATKDAVAGPVKGALGWFVVQVTGVVEGGTAPFETVKQALRDRVLTEKALDIVYERANKIDGLLANGSTLDALPGDLGVSAVVGTMDQRGITPAGQLAPIPGGREIRDAVLAAAFEAPKGEAAHLTEVATPSVGGSGYYALVVEDVAPTAAKPFETIQATVADDWRADRRRRVAEQAAAGLLHALKDGKAFSDAARDAGVAPRLSPLVTRSDPNPDMPPEVHQVLFTLKKAEPAMVETAEGFLVAVPVETIAPDPQADPAGYERVRAAVTRTIGNDLATLFLEALRQRAKPRINQSNLDQIVQSE